MYYDSATIMTLNNTEQRQIKLREEQVEVR